MAFVRVREDFECARCARSVRGDGYTNHCPSCLWSRHVDVEPGDRAEACRGMMRPIGALAEGDGVRLAHRCEGCGRSRNVKSAAGDDFDAVLALMGHPVRHP